MRPIRVEFIHRLFLREPSGRPKLRIEQSVGFKIFNF